MVARAGRADGVIASTTGPACPPQIASNNPVARSIA